MAMSCSSVPAHASSERNTGSRLHSAERRNHILEETRREIERRFPRISVISDDFPDECLAYVFAFLDLIDRQNCSLVCRRWLRIEGHSRRRLCLDGERHKASYIHRLPNIPSLLTRFDSFTSLALKFVFVDDHALALISLRCRNLTSLKLYGCKDLTDAGVADFAVNCKGLKKFHAEGCKIGAEGINAIVDNSPLLEELTALNLRGLACNAAAAMSIGPGVAASTLKAICIGRHFEKGMPFANIPNGQCFGPLIIASKNLRILKIYGSSGDWDKVFEAMVEQGVTGLVEIQLEALGISDSALISISNFLNLEMLHLETINCTKVGLAYMANRCKRLRRLHIQRKMRTDDSIGDEGIIPIAKGCGRLEELNLIHVSITSLSLNMLAENCPNLESLALCCKHAVGDAEMSLIAAKFMALTSLKIQCCGITDQGALALSSGCPNLVHLEIYDCNNVTSAGLNRLKAERNSLVVNYHRCPHHVPLLPVRRAPMNRHI